MKGRAVHGLASLVLILAAVLIGFFSIFAECPAAALVYLLLLPAGSATIVYAFCTKCPCRNMTCGHLIPGALARFFPGRQSGPYLPADIAGVAIPLLLIIAIPLFWLYRIPLLLAVYLVLIALALLDIRLKVCPGCSNAECPVQGRRP